jgi:hypothetical protein
MNDFQAPALAVLMATHDGADTLDRTLDSFARLQSPQGGWRLVVIDNAGDEASLALLQRHAARLPMAILREPRRGKNRALNLALDQLAGHVAHFELVVFTDDDVLPAPNWLIALQDAARNAPEAALFGGAVEPAFEVAPPEWLQDFAPVLGMLYAQAERPAGPCPPDALFGPNLAVRGRVLAETGIRYNERIGPNGCPIYPMGSETELMLRLGEAGYAAWFTPAARVGHIVSALQLDERWILRRAYRHGLGMSMRSRRRWLELGGKLTRAWGGGALKGALAWGAGDARLARLAAFNRAWGRGALAGLLGRHR